jgi:hypothetical protein
VIKAEEEAAASEATQGLVLDKQSGRLQALAGLVSALHALGKLVLVVAQSSKVGWIGLRRLCSTCGGGELVKSYALIVCYQRHKLPLSHSV